MTMYVRWKRPNPPVHYQYFEVALAKWVDCYEPMIRHFLERGDAVHMNPKFDPTLHAASEVRA